EMADGHRAVNTGNCTRQCSPQIAHVSDGMHSQHHCRGWLLCEGEIDVPFNGAQGIGRHDLVVTHTFYQPNHSHPLRRLYISKAYALANGVFTRPKGLRRVPADDRYLFSILAVRQGEIAAGQKWNFHGFEIPRTDQEIPGDMRGRTHLRTILDNNGSTGERFHRHFLSVCRSVCRALHSRQRRDPVLKVAIKLKASVMVLAELQAGRYVSKENMVLAEAGGGVAEPAEIFDEQSCPAAKNYRHGDFRNHQGPGELPSSAAYSRRLRVGTQCLLNIRL